MDELSEKIYDAVLAFVEDVDNGKLSMAEAEDYAIGYISTEISEYVEQRQESIITVLENRKDYWQDKARKALVSGESIDEVEDFTEMYGLYIDVISDIK